MSATASEAFWEGRAVVPRVNAVKRCRKSPGSCGKCGRKISKRDPYRFWKFRFGGRRVRCMEARCSPRASDLTNSDKLSRVYAVGETIEDAIEAFRKDFDVEALKGACGGAAEELREVAGEYRESAESVESGMNGNRMPICDELEEKADNLESKADEIDQAAGDLEEFDEEAAEEEAEAEVDEAEEKDDEIIDNVETRRKMLVGEKKKEWAEEQVSGVEDFTSIEVDG